MSRPGGQPEPSILRTAGIDRARLMTLNTGGVPAKSDPPSPEVRLVTPGHSTLSHTMGIRHRIFTWETVESALRKDGRVAITLK